YDAINDLTLAIMGLLKPEFEEVFIGSATVKQIFKIRKLGTIAGCQVDKGVIKINAAAKVFRNGGEIYSSTVSSLKHYAEDAKEVKSGTDCGIGIENFNDLKEGDVIEAYETREIERKLN
ncbi:MAG: translation initiation factor IF-2, partial [Candidatus Cloacimonetes bacterium]|nr:translation initiation factor IF-2 [Candidatus Cloacimonadota bacterium]